LKVVQEKQLFSHVTALINRLYDLLQHPAIFSNSLAD